MTQRPAVIEGMLWPLLRGETLSNHDWFPFYTHRFLSSGFVNHVTLGSRCRADLGTALILWAESMRMDPAGTLPIDDLDLAGAARFPSVDAWLEAKEGALYGWVPVNVEDDRTGDMITRLGHPFTLEVVSEMMTRAKARKAARTAGADRKRSERIRKKLKGLGLPKHITESEEIVARLQRHFSLADIFITDENVRAALSEVIGYTSDVVPLGRQSRKGKSTG